MIHIQRVTALHFLVTIEPSAPAGTGLTKARVEALTEGIFAVAMTLLILDVKVPVVSHPAELMREVLALWPKCLSYIISFVMLGIYWVGQHNQFHLIGSMRPTGIVWSIATSTSI